MRVAAFLGPIVLCLLLGVAGAMAQPGQTQPPPRQPGPPPAGTHLPPPQPAPYGVAHGRGSNYHLLTMEERQLLMNGEISLLQTLVGGGVAWSFGFGLGHAVQGRYEEVGWKFTLGDGAAMAGLIIGISMAVDPHSRYPSETGERLLIASAISLGVLRIWQFVDTLTGPGAHNKKVRAARTKAFGYSPPRYGLFVAPTTEGGGGIAGLRASF